MYRNEPQGQDSLTALEGPNIAQLEQRQDQQRYDDVKAYALLDEVDLTSLEQLTSHSSTQAQHGEFFEGNTRLYVKDVLKGTTGLRVLVNRTDKEKYKDYVRKYRTDEHIKRPKVEAELDCRTIVEAEIDWAEPPRIIHEYRRQLKQSKDVEEQELQVELEGRQPPVESENQPQGKRYLFEVWTAL